MSIDAVLTAVQRDPGMYETVEPALRGLIPDDHRVIAR
jgi:hypothetical protein